MHAGMLHLSIAGFVFDIICLKTNKKNPFFLDVQLPMNFNYCQQFFGINPFLKLFFLKPRTTSSNRKDIQFTVIVE